MIRWCQFFPTPRPGGISAPETSSQTRLHSAFDYLKLSDNHSVEKDTPYKSFALSVPKYHSLWWKRVVTCESTITSQPAKEITGWPYKISAEKTLPITRLNTTEVMILLVYLSHDTLHLNPIHWGHEKWCLNHQWKVPLYDRHISMSSKTALESGQAMSELNAFLCSRRSLKLLFDRFSRLGWFFAALEECVPLPTNLLSQSDKASVNTLWNSVQNLLCTLLWSRAAWRPLCWLEISCKLIKKCRYS